jgi:serine/threonine-protein kinase
MLDPQTSRFWQATLLSGLMDAQSLNACWNAIAPEKRDAPEHIDRRLARQAVEARALTLWQAQQLLAGRTRGFQVDRYLLTDLIGEGGMARVYLATDTRLRRRVALKILSPDRVNSRRAVARFQREAQLGAQLQHENLVRIYDTGESSGRYYLVMEYIEGNTLENLIAEQGSMPPAQAVRLVRHVALGLEHLHRKGLIHRDVNPRNVLVTRDGTAKLADLGIAVDLADQERVTREGATVGTLDYLAPEQARDSHAADIRSDIYSLGCTLYRLIGGQVPFRVPSLAEKLLAHQTMNPTPLNHLVPDLSPDLAEIVARMMSKSPDQRYAAPIQVAQALRPFEIGSNCIVHSTEGIGPVRGIVDHRPPESPRFVPEPRLPVGKVVRPGVASLQTTSTERSIARGPARSEIDAAEPPASMVGPDKDVGSSDPDLTFFVDLGPEPSLSEQLSRAKSRFRHMFSTSTGSAATPATTVPDAQAGASNDPERIPRRLAVRRWGLVALLALVAVSITTLAVVRTSGKKGANPVATRRPNFVVRLHDGGASVDDESRDISLLDAMRIAIANRGYVELCNSEPLRLVGDKPLDFRTARGKLDIRAAPGMAPVIEVGLKGATPFLQTGSAVPLEITGLTIVVRRLEASRSESTPPLILAAGKTRLVRCAFRTESGVEISDSRAVLGSGGALEVDRCWFEGFNKAIDIYTAHGNTARIHQTLIVAGSQPNEARTGARELHGWAVRLQHLLGGPPQTNNEQPCLVFDHCTFEGAGFVDLGNRPPPSPYRVEVKHCAVRAEALLAWKPSKPDESPTAQIKWLGAGNQYDIRDRSWIVLSASQGTPALSTEVVDFDSWSTVAREIEPIRARLHLQIDSQARSGQLQPHDFAISHSGPTDRTPGANPELVGPWSELSPGRLANDNDRPDGRGAWRIRAEHGIVSIELSGGPASSHPAQVIRR